MYIILHRSSEYYSAFEDLESLRTELEVMSTDDPAAFNASEVYEVFQPLEMVLIPTKIHFPEKD